MLIVLSGAGCQSYAPKPPDLQAHHAAWLKRSASSEQVQQFAHSLRAADEPVSVGDDVLTVDQAELVALLFNADLRLARSRAGISRASAEHAGLWDDPVANLGLERMLSGGSHPWMAMTSVGFTLPISGRLEIEKQLAQQSHHASLHALAHQEWIVRMQVRRTWIAYSAARLKQQVASEFLANLEEIVEIVSRMEEVGELARIQGRLFHIELAHRRNQVVQINREIKEAEIALRRLLGLWPGAAIALAPQGVSVTHVHVEDSASVIRERHPQLQTLLAEHEATERELELAVRRQYPDLTISPGHNYEEASHRLTLGFSIPLPIWNRNQQQIAQATAKREHAQVIVETAYESLVLDYTLAEVQLAAIDEQYERVANTTIPFVDQQYTEARRIAELGEVDTLLLLDTLRRQFETKLELIELEATRAIAMIQLQSLLGPPPDDAVARRLREINQPAQEISRD